MTPLRIRKRCRIRLIELNQPLFLKVLKERQERRHRGVYKTGMSEGEQEIARLARTLIGYSCRTNDADIVHSLLNMAEYDLKIQIK